MNTRRPTTRAPGVTAGPSGQQPVPPGVTADVLIVGAGPVVMTTGELRRRVYWVARLEVWQDGRRLATGVSFGMKPDRPVRLSASWTSRADPGGGPVTVRLA